MVTSRPARFLLAIVVLLPGVAGSEAAAAAGFYVTVALSGSELKAPKQTPETDLDLFSGLGLAPAFG